MAKSPNTTTAPTGNIPPFGLRMLPELREKIESAAKTSGRSMNAEIVARLDQSFGSGGEGTVSIAQTLRELESLQKLGSLTYELQRATYKADALRTHISQAYDRLQQVIERGSGQQQKEAKAVYLELQTEKDRFVAEVENIEKQISEIHLERKVSGLKELRDVQPIYASVRGVWGDTGAVVHDATKNAKLKAGPKTPVPPSK